MSLQRRASRWLCFPARFEVILPQGFTNSHVTHFTVGFVFRLFLRRSNPSALRRRSRGGSGPHPRRGGSADTTLSFGVFEHLCTIIPCAAAGKSHATGAFVLHVALALARSPRLRFAPLFRIRIAKSRRRHSSIITMR